MGRPLPSPIDALALDFDGVLTDNLVYTFEDGREAVRCSRSDGMGIEFLRRRGVPVVVLSKERNEVVTNRCRKLDVECVQGLEDKLQVLARWAKERLVDLSRTVYVGNDVNDIECMRAVGFAAVPSDAHPDCATLADRVLSRPGGQGAVREMCDLILKQDERQGDT